MTKKKLSSLEILKKDVIAEIHYDLAKLVRMVNKLKEIEKKITEAND